MVLVLSSGRDEHAEAVLSCLARDGVPARLLDLSEFPQRWRLSMSYKRSGSFEPSFLAVNGEELPVSSCQVVWWRRPQPFVLHPEIATPAHQSFVFNECHTAIFGLWLSLDAFWVNHPTRDEEASHKAYQLKVAQDVGLEIPLTLITNDPDQARAFVESLGPERTIYKSFSATERDWRETRVLKPEEVALLDSVKFAPVIFQEYVPAQVDLRITVVGSAIFAAAIHSQETSYKADYRMDMGTARVEPLELPDEVARRLLALMQRLGLAYGAIDMRLTPDGRFVFLEVNPAGQWLFVAERTGQPITETLARLLALHDRASPSQR